MHSLFTKFTSLFKSGRFLWVTLILLLFGRHSSAPDDEKKFSGDTSLRSLIFYPQDPIVLPFKCGLIRNNKDIGASKLSERALLNLGLLSGPSTSVWLTRAHTWLVDEGWWSWRYHAVCLTALYFLLWCLGVCLAVRGSLVLFLCYCFFHLVACRVEWPPIVEMCRILSLRVSGVPCLCRLYQKILGVRG